jgi:hypothetical protein
MRHMTTFILATAAGLFGTAVALAGPGAGGSAAALKAKQTELGDKLQKSPFGRPVYLVANEGDSRLKGDVFAVVDHPYKEVEAAFRDPASWCDVLILPFNTKHCHASAGDEPTLTVRIGRKADQPAEDAFPIAFKYRADARDADYFRTALRAGSGPLGTKDYEITLEATPLDEKRTFLHLGYAYAYGVMSQLAMQTYLSTTGANKVGFTVTGKDEQGKPQYCGGMIGATERNTMRYYLAIEAYLNSLSAPEGQRVAKRLDEWFALTEKYPRQLHEMDRGKYVAMKTKETQRNKQAL